MKLIERLAQAEAQVTDLQAALQKLSREKDELRKLLDSQLEKTKQIKVLDADLAIPYSWIKPYEARAIKNHSQSLDQLNARGGLTILEIYAVINDLSNSAARKKGVTTARAGFYKWTRDMRGPLIKREDMFHIVCQVADEFSDHHPSIASIAYCLKNLDLSDLGIPTEKKD